MKITRQNIYLFSTIFFAVTGIWLYYDWSIEKVNPILCLLNFIPSVSFYIIYILEKDLGKKKVVQALIFIIILSTIILYLLFIYIMNTFIPVFYGITNLRKYPSILTSNWGRQKHLVKHFPRRIPIDAEHVKFFYRMGYMQGGSALQLRYSLSPDKIAELYEKFSKIKTKAFQGGNSNEHMNQKNGMPTTFFYTGDTADNKFPDDYEIMIFDWIPSEKEKKRRGLKRSFNHGESHGVVISKKRNTIVYWAESW